MKSANLLLAMASIGLIVFVNDADAAHIPPNVSLCNWRGCSMTLDDFAERMSFSSGTQFIFSNSLDLFCRRNKNTLGYYSPASHTITLCNENAASADEIANTIVHETVHAGQECFKSNVPFTKGVLSSKEKAMVQRLYPSSQWQGEYNARAIANYLVRHMGESDRFSRIIEKACANIRTEHLPRNSSIRPLHP